ncbi:hypothetical protein BKH41_07785 [Helicobacter sp. 12S02232-10]|uniref:hypothetical protein n=1 Tax=Helicobacter sp. 12S02232-10 TaxID=1476197 RepID=UPI000BA6A4B6|nr:hypothetical protein [Helicobacter sp. 12S02232-10]PAF47173.1 hypothetical protein BKH41_07785 [Helicobacter sp. 12S02232-10]
MEEKYLRIKEHEKEELLFEEEHTKGLSVNALFAAYMILVFSLIVLLPKIYLASNIYYVSRDIAKLQTQENLLKEENHRLERELEDVRFKYLMMDLS